MVAAYLRGLLKPSHQFGLRSAIAEDVILEGLAADMNAQAMADGIRVDTGTLPVLTEKGIRATVQRINYRLGRISQLRGQDIYRVAEQLAGRLKLENRSDELSLFQLYQIAEKKGIFKAFDEHFDESALVPLL